jgi:hypothetical protein
MRLSVWYDAEQFAAGATALTGRGLSSNVRSLEKSHGKVET